LLPLHAPSLSHLLPLHAPSHSSTDAAPSSSHQLERCFFSIHHLQRCFFVEPPLPTMLFRRATTNDAASW
ncbi:hypothetical protein LINPERHAP2_LOCUS11616, partial [Linum perenne]